MHNLISHNQLGGWKLSVNHLESTIDSTNSQNEMINDYFNCLLECDTEQSKRICKEMLN